jgi:SNF2 family DNA or RNA helicase
MENLTFDVTLLVSYKGINKFILSIKEKYLDYLVSEKRLKITDIENVIKKKPKPAFLIYSDKAVLREIVRVSQKNGVFTESRHIEGLLDKGFVAVCHKGDGEAFLGEEENLFLLRCFGFKEEPLNNREITLGGGNQKIISEIFDTDKKIEKIKASHYLGETEEYAYFRYNLYFYRLYKGDPLYQDPIRKEWMELDFDEAYFNKQCKWGEWIERGYALTPHQVEGIKFTLYKKRSLIFDRAGTGKTIMGVVAALASRSRRCLIMTQLHLKPQWEKTVKYFTDDCKMIQNNEARSGSEKFHIMHYQQLDNPKMFFDKEFCYEDNAYDFIIFDETHEIKNMTGIRGKAAKNLCSLSTTKYVMALTASPFESNEQLFGIYTVLGVESNGLFAPPKSSWGEKEGYAIDFKTRYCGAYKMKKGGREFFVCTKNTNTYELAQRIKHSFLCRTDLDIPGFPEIEVNRQELLLMPEKRGELERMKEELEETYEKMKIKVGTQKLKSAFENMLSADSFKMTYGEVCLFLSEQSDKIPKKHREEIKEIALEGMTKKELYLYLKNNCLANFSGINEQLPIMTSIREFLAHCAIPQTVRMARNLVDEGKKVIIFTHYTSEFKTLCMELAEEAVWVHVNKKDRYKKKSNEDIIKLFKGEKNILIGNLKTLGTGHDLPEADASIFNIPNFASGEHMQGMSRARRLNRKEKVEVYLWSFKDTLLERVFKINDEKRVNTNILLNLPIDYV